MKTSHDVADFEQDGFQATIVLEWHGWAVAATVVGRTVAGEAMPGCRAPTSGYLPPDLLPEYLDAELVARSVWSSEDQAERYLNFVRREVRHCIGESASGLPFSATVRLGNGRAWDLNYASCAVLVRVLGGIECLSGGEPGKFAIPCSFTGRELVERFIGDDWGAPPVGVALEWTSADEETWQVGIDFSEERCFSRHRLKR